MELLKILKVAVCGMKCVNLCKDTIRITGVLLFYKKIDKMRRVSWKQ